MPSPMERDVAEFIDGISHELGALEWQGLGHAPG